MNREESTTVEKKPTPSKQSKEWLEKNRSALESYNKRVDTRGVFSDDVRLF